MQVFVVTEIDQGWNAPIAVFQGVKWETLEHRFPSHKYMIDELEVEKNLKDWPQDE